MLTILLQGLNESPLHEIMPATQVTAFIIFIVVLLFFGALAAGAEVAFFTLSAKDINYLKTKEQPGSNQLITLLKKPQSLLSTLRSSKYFLVFATVIAINYLAHLILYQQKPGDTLNTGMYFLMLIGIAILLLLFVEILPKVYARQNNMRLALFAAPIVQVLYYIFKPISGLLADSEEYRELKEARRQKDVELDSTELQQAIELSIGHAATKEEVDIFKGIMRFGDITVRQIMTPRLEINAIRESWNLKQVREKVLAAGYSRLPVYRDNIDKIIGMINTKDLLPYTDMDELDWHTLIRPAFFVHGHKLIEDLFKEFQERRQHFAVIVDEYGGTLGVVTLEDIMEEIVGDIRDEFDEEEHNFKKLDNKNYIFEGKILINDMCRIIGVPFSTFDNIKGQSDSVAGLILEIAGRFPNVNERINYKKIDFVVLSIDKLRIGLVKIEME